MRIKMMLVLIISMIILCSCSKSSNSNEASSNNQKATLAYANKIDLFNALEKITDLLKDKKYIEAYDALTEIYKLTNKANIVAEKSDISANKYITNLNQLSEDVQKESNNQKNNEIIFAYQKSQLSLISNATQSGGSSGGASSESGSSGGSGGSSSGGSGGSSSGSSGSSNAGSDSSSQSAGGNKQEQIIIPEEEALKKYPEILISDYDKQIMDLAVDLMGHVTKISLEGDPENTVAITNREKYLLYKISSLVALNQYDSVDDFISEAQNNWDKLYTKVQEKNQEDVMTLNALLKNINTSVIKKNSVAVKLQSEIAIKLLDNLATKSQT